MVPEVCIFFENRLMRGNRTTKINAEGVTAFRSFNFPSLADAGIQTGMIATSEIRITTTVEAADIEMAARVVHAAFNLGQVSA